MRTTSGLPEFIGEGCDVGMSECGDAMSNRMSGLSMLMSVVGVLEGLTRLFVSGQVILSVLLADTMGVFGKVVQFGALLVVLVMRSVVIAGRHN
jgi:hypothetical protein